MKQADKKTASILMAGVLTVGIAAGAIAANTNGAYADEMGYAHGTSVTNKATNVHQTRVNNVTPTLAPSAHHALQAWMPLSLFARNAQPTHTNALTVIHVSAAGNDTNDGTSAANAVKTLEKALEKAPDGATIAVHGEIKIPQTVTITKNVTLVAGDATAKITSTGAASTLLLATNGKTLTLGNAQSAAALGVTGAPAAVTGTASSNTLTFEKTSVKVTAGRVELFDGARFVNSSLTALQLTGAQATGAVYGGTVTMDPTTANPEYACYVTGGAQLECIKGGSFSTRGSVVKVEGENSKIGEISGGTFSNNKHETYRNGTSCVLVQHGGSIDKISGGSFTSVWDAALDVRDGGWVGEVSGGTFLSTPDVSYHKYQNGNHWWRYHYFTAVLVYVTQVTPYPIHKTGIGTISGGTFNGVHAIFAVGNNAITNEEIARPCIDKITGGNFTSTAIPNLPQSATMFFDAVFLGQVSKVGTIEGGTFKTSAGSALKLEGSPNFDERVATINEIKGGTFESSKFTAAVVNQGTITKISNGTFTSEHGCALAVTSGSATHFGTVEEIADGVFKGTSGALDVDNYGVLKKVSKGVFYAKDDVANDNYAFSATIRNHTNQQLELEPELNNTQKDRGEGRYFAHLRKDQWWVHTAITTGNVMLPQYDGPDGTKKSYVMSGYNYVYPFKTAKKPKEHESPFTFYRVLYIKTDKSRGSISWKNNDYYDASEGFDGTYHTIYALEQTYDNTGNMLDNGYRYLKKQAKVSYDANFPKNTRTEGDVPQKPFELKAFNYDSYENGVPFKNGEPAQSLFEVKDNTGKLKATGYEFIGWNTKADGSGIWLKPHAYVAMPAYNVTLYAQWKSNAYTVTFKNGHETYASVKVEKGKAIDNDSLKDQSMPQDPVKEGYTFKGWNTKEDGKGDVFSGSTVVKQDEIVYAQFEKVAEEEPQVAPLYRLYNPYTHEHFFTAETVENDNLVRLGWKSEGGVGYIYKHAEKGGVYRLYNPSTGEHHYTTEENELAECIKAGWKNEGVKWFSAQNKEVTLNKLYSMYNPYEKKFYHHYTADAKEIEQMVKAGWRKEEVKWCTLPVSYIIKK